MLLLLFFRELREKAYRERYADKACHDISYRLCDLNARKTPYKTEEQNYRDKAQAVS